MRTRLLLLLAITLASITSQAQNIIENNFLIIDVPEGWEVQKMNMTEANMQVVAFCNKGNAMYNTGLIVGLDKYVDPEMAIQSQIATETNQLLKGSTFGDIYSSTFMGKPAKAINYENIMNGIKYKGSIYAFNENGCTLICYGMYDVSKKSNLPQIWRSIKWKRFTRQENIYTDVREETQAFINEMNPIWKRSPLIADGEQMVSMRIDDNPVCLVYVKKVLELNANSLPQDKMDTFTKIVKENLVAQTKKNLEAGTTLVKNWIEAGYLIKYEFYDMNDVFICDIVIRPEELK